MKKEIVQLDAANEEFLDLRQMVRRLWAARVWLAASTLVFAIAAAAYALSSERVYRATVLLAPAESNAGDGGVGALLGQVGGLASLAGINLRPEGANIEEALAVLRSREFTVRFFEDEKILPKFFPDDWDPEAGKWKEGVKPPSISRAYVLFDSEVRRIVQNKKTGLISLHVEWTDRAEAAHWANDLVRRVNEEMRVRAIRDANLSIEFLKKELDETQAVEVREAINRLIEGQIKQRMLANVNREYAFRVIDRAVTPELDEAVRPHRRKIVIVGAMLGFVCAAMALLLLDYFRRSV